MPKFTYTASKGIEQSSGSGFVVEDVSIAPSVRSYTASDATANAVDFDALGYAEQVINVDVDADLTITIPNGTVIGEEKIVVIAGQTGDLTVTDAGSASPISGVTVATGAVYVLVYTATDTWKLIS